MNEESGEEILECNNLKYDNRQENQPIRYDWKNNAKSLRKRQHVLEAGVN